MKRELVSVHCPRAQRRECRERVSGRESASAAATADTVKVKETVERVGGERERQSGSRPRTVTGKEGRGREKERSGRKERKRENK